MTPSKPLVVVTRDEGDGGPLASALTAGGAEVFYLTTITFAPPVDPAALDRALALPDGYHWVVFTSPRAVEAVCSRPAWVRAWESHVCSDSVPSATLQDPDDAATSMIPQQGASMESLARPSRWQIAAAGRTTAKRLAAFGVTVAVVPEQAGAAALAEALVRGAIARSVAGSARGEAARIGIARPLTGARILWPRSEIADRSLAATLASAGAEVVEVVAYRTVSTSGEPLVLAAAKHSPAPRGTDLGEADAAAESRSADSAATGSRRFNLNKTTDVGEVPPEKRSRDSGAAPDSEEARDGGAAREFRRLLDSGRIAAVTFLSPSSARGLAAAAGAADLSFLAGRTAIASIGPTTSAALSALGAPANVESPERTADSLARALMRWLDARREVAR